MFVFRRMTADAAVKGSQKHVAGERRSPMGLLRKIVDGYNHLLNHRPRLLLGTQSGLLMAAGDFISQTCVERVPLREVEPYRVLRFGLIGACIAGPGLKAWFYGLDKFIGREMTAKKAMIKTFIDQGVLAPPMLASLVGSVQFAKTKDLEKTVAWGKEHGWEILKTNWTLWPVVQMVNFRYVSLEYRLLLAQCVALFWNVYLAYKANRDEDLDPSPVLSSTEEKTEECSPAPSKSFAPLLSFESAVRIGAAVPIINEDDVVSAISLPAVISPPPPSSKSHYAGIYRLYSEFSQCESFWH